MSYERAKAYLEKVGGMGVPTIKPWNREAVFEKLDVLKKHGTFAVGTDIMDAFDQVDVFNKAATIYLRAKSMGFEPEGMTDEAMEEVQRVFRLPKRRPV